MNICIALSQFYPRYYGGMTKDAHDVAQALSMRGHQVWVLCTESGPSPKNTFVTEDEYQGLSVVRLWLDLLPRDYSRRLSSFDEHIGHIVQELLAERATDLLHVWNFASLTTAIVPAAHQIGIPVVYTATDYGATCWRYTLVRWDGSLCDGHENLVACLECLKPWSSKAERLFRVLKPLGNQAGGLLVDIAAHMPSRKPWLIDQALDLRSRLDRHHSALLSID